MAGSLVIEDRLNLRGLVSVPRLTIGTEHDWYAGVAERLDSFACVLVPGNVVLDVRDVVLVEFPFRGETSGAVGLGEQFSDGLVGVHGVLSGCREGPPPEQRWRAGVWRGVRWPSR